MYTRQTIQNEIAKAVDAARKTNPLVGSITNDVTINLVANAQLAVGGSAAMLYLEQESEELIEFANSFYINMGTLLPLHEETLPNVAKLLHESGKPWVLDPVAVGIGAMRTVILTQMKASKPTIIRGNASEVKALADLWVLISGEDFNVRGVDATDSVTSAKDAAKALARYTGGAVAVSGATDLITDGKMVILSHGGSPLFEKITGAGCSLGGVTAVYAAVASPFIAALTATAIYNHCGFRAAKDAHGPGSFQTLFLDELYNASALEVAQNTFEILED